MERAVCVGAALNFGEDMYSLGGVPAVGFEVIGFDHVEHVNEEDAAGGGRAHRDNFVFFVGTCDWIAVDGFVVLEIGEGDETAEFLLLCREKVCGFVRVKSVASMTYDSLEGSCEILLDKAVAFFPGLPVVANEDFGCAGIFLESAVGEF